MNGCVYRTTDDKCEFYSDYGKGIVSYCDFDDCEEKKPSNADRIRAMSDDELAEWMATKVTCMRCPVDLSVCQNAYYDKDGKCDRILLDWLKAPVEDVDK